MILRTSASFFAALSLLSMAARGEQVNCVAGPPGKQTSIEVLYTHFPGSLPGHQSLTAIVKTPARHWGDNYTVRRKMKSGVVLYNDFMGGKSLSLAIKTSQVGGTNLAAEAVLDKGAWFEQRLTGLTCAITGAPNPPVETCPAPRELTKALFTAAKYETAERVEWLLDCSASVNAKDERGCTPLLAVADLACGYRPSTGESPVQSPRGFISFEEIVGTLISYGASLDARDPVNGETALMKLIKYGDLSVSPMLIERKASVDAQDIQGNTALMLAAASGNDILVKIVLDGKPDLTLKNRKGETAYKIAQRLGYSYLLPLLEAKPSSQTIEGKDDGSCAPTMVHVFKGKPVEIVLKSSKDQMFLLTAPDLGLELMAMPNKSVSQTITPEKKGTFPFTCGIHGGEKQTKGGIMVM